MKFEIEADVIYSEIDNTFGSQLIVLFNYIV